MSGRLVVIGGDAAGLSCAAEARRADPGREIVVLERGREVSYAACGIPYWIGRLIEDRDDLVANTVEDLRTRRRLDVRLETPAERIDPEAREVLTADGARIAYDDLVIATGARAVRPPVPGADAPRVLTLRDLADADRLDTLLPAARGGRALVVGAGPIGLEMAGNLCRRGLGVHVVEADEAPVPSLHPDVAAPVRKAMARGCASLRSGTAVDALLPRADGVAAVIGGVEEAYDLVLLGTGVRPNAELGAAAGCATGEAGALRVDRTGRTTVPGIWAAGDCATAWHRILERDVWTPLATTANRMGRVVGRDVSGRRTPFPGIVGAWMSEAFGLGFGAVGLDEDDARAAGFAPESVTRTGRDRAGYMPGAEPVVVRLVFDGPTGRLLGGASAGGADVASRLHALSIAVTAGMTVADLAGVDLAYAPPLAALRDPLELAAAAVTGDAP